MTDISKEAREQAERKEIMSGCCCPNHESFNKHACPCILEKLELQDELSRTRELARELLGYIKGLVVIDPIYRTKPTQDLIVKAKKELGEK